MDHHSRCSMVGVQFQLCWQTWLQIGCRRIIHTEHFRTVCLAISIVQPPSQKTTPSYSRTPPDAPPNTIPHRVTPRLHLQQIIYGCDRHEQEAGMRCQLHVHQYFMKPCLQDALLCWGAAETGWRPPRRRTKVSAYMAACCCCCLAVDIRLDEYLNCLYCWWISAGCRLVDPGDGVLVQVPAVVR